MKKMKLIVLLVLMILIVGCKNDNTDKINYLENKVKKLDSKISKMYEKYNDLYGEYITLKSSDEIVLSQETIQDIGDGFSVCDLEFNKSVNNIPTIEGFIINTTSVIYKDIKFQISFDSDTTFFTIPEISSGHGSKFKVKLNKPSNYSSMDSKGKKSIDLLLFGGPVGKIKYVSSTVRYFK